MEIKQAALQAHAYCALAYYQTNIVRAVFIYLF